MTDILKQLEDKDMFDCIKAWVKGTAAEVGWWDTVLYEVKYGNDLRKERLTSREFVYKFNKKIKFNSNDIIIDIGSGPLPVYGNIINGKEINYLPLDPLAYEYKKLYKKYNINLPVEPSFAIMENLSSYVSEKVDYVICTNAMDHSIDPVCAIVECVKVLKQGGTLLLAHLESEAEYANYDGLHQWNITNRNNELVFYNYEKETNMSKLLSDFCKVEITNIAGEGGRFWNVAKIVKDRDIDINVRWDRSSSFYVSMLSSCLMEALANSNGLYFPCGEQYIPDDYNFIVFGMGNGGVRVLSYFGKRANKIKYFIDNSVSNTDSWKGFPVRNPSLLEKSANDLILIASTTFANEMKAQLVSMGFIHGKDFLLFDEFKHKLSTCFD